MADVTHRTLDGWRLRLSGEVDLTRPGTSVAGVVVAGNLHELTAGPLGLGEEIAKASGIPRFDEELHFQGGTLRIGRTIRYDAGIRLAEELLVAVWQGRRHSLVMQLYRGTTADVLGLLRPLGIVEYDDGIVLRPGPGAEFADRASVIKEVPGLGLLEAGPPDGKPLPEWRGATTRAGRLYRDDLGNGSPYFVLAGPDTFATVVPLAGTAVDDIPAVADRLTLEAVPA
jgi:hypothetical protein